MHFERLKNRRSEKYSIHRKQLQFKNPNLQREKFSKIQVSVSVIKCVPKIVLFQKSFQGGHHYVSKAYFKIKKCHKITLRRSKTIVASRDITECG